MKAVFNKRNFYILGAIFIGILFFYMTYNTPLAGDDWGYALGGDKPLENAIGLYKAWSGRFFSELWGYLVAPRKRLWNILNPLLFVSLFVGIYYLCNIKNKYILSVLLLLSTMLNVATHLRMETYTWIMGDTYVIPLVLSVWYFVIIRKMVSTRLISGWLKVGAYLSNILLFIIGLMMENIAAMMLAGVIILIIYAYFTRRYLLKYLIINLVFILVAFLLMRLSPGSTARLIRDNPEFANLSIIQKIIINYPSFIKNTFTNNYYTIGIFAIIITLYLFFTDNKKMEILRYTSIALQLICIFSLFSFVLGPSFLNDSNSIYSFIFWPIYIIDIFLIFIFIFDNHVLQERSIFYLLIGGGSALVMLMSPIYGPRSSIYVVYYLIVLSLIILDSIKINYPIKIVLFVLFLVLISTRTYRLIKKYHLVGLRQAERMEVIKYYQEHPEDKEAYIPRMPIESVHSGDVEPEDLYHLETFKNYYNLPQDAKNIKFYYVVDK